MYSYVSKELPKIVETYFHISSERKSITGFSMGGLGALTVGLRNLDKYRSISAFSPISNISES
jgi:S-formylglutathione hydrolase